MATKSDTGRERPPGAPSASKPSAFVGTRVIYCGDCLDQLKKLPDACVNLTSNALHEIDRFFKEEHRIIIPLTVREILDEEIARKLA
jgi:hypothetical protein